MAHAASTALADAERCTELVHEAGVASHSESAEAVRRVNAELRARCEQLEHEAQQLRGAHSVQGQRADELEARLAERDRQLHEAEAERLEHRARLETAAATATGYASQLEAARAEVDRLGSATRAGQEARAVVDEIRAAVIGLCAQVEAQPPPEDQNGGLAAALRRCGDRVAELQAGGAAAKAMVLQLNRAGAEAAAEAERTGHELAARTQRIAELEAAEAVRAGAQQKLARRERQLRYLRKRLAYSVFEVRQYKSHAATLEGMVGQLQAVRSG